jgi:serine/threonine-protein kinase
MLGDYGEVYLLDWGLALRTTAPARGRAKLLGSPAYMAPEMAAVEPLSTRTDVYLLGATLHEVLTGRPRHRGETLRQVLLCALQSEPAVYGDDVPAELAELASAATARDPEARPATAMAFRSALLDYEKHRTSRALCRAADQRLSALQRALGEAVEGQVPPGLRAQIDECRLSYRQALQEWEGNPRALGGHRACQALAVRCELRQGNLEGARAALVEIDTPDAELIAEFERLAALRQADTEEHDRLRQMAQDLDPWRVSWGMRMALVFPLVAVVIGAAVWGAVLRARGTTPGMPYSLAVAIALLVAVLTPGLLLRRRLLVNAFSRRVFGAVLVLLGTLVVSRLLGLACGTPVHRVLLNNAVIILGFAAMAGLLLQRVFWVGLPLFATAIVVGLTAPGWLPAALNAAALLSLAIIALAWRRGLSARGEDPETKTERSDG